MKFLKSIPALIILVMQITGIAGAEERVFSLNDCMAAAMEKNPRILSADVDKKKSRAEYRFVRSKSSLQVSADIKTVERLKSDANPIGNFNVPGVDTTYGILAGVNASYKIIDIQQNRLVNQARIRIDLTKTQKQKIVREVLFEVKQAYYSYIMSSELLKLNEELVERNQKKLKVAQFLFNSGRKSILDITKAEVDLHKAQLDYEKIRNSHRLNRIKLFESMGLGDPGKDVVLEKNEDLPELKYGMEDLKKLAEIYSPELQIIKTQKRYAWSQITVDKAQRFPVVEFQFGLGFENDSIQGLDNLSENFASKNWKPRFSGAFRAYFPIFTGGAVSAKVDMSKMDYQKLVYQEREISMNISNVLLANYNNLKELMKQIELTKLSMESARKHLALAQKSYQGGIATQLELQDAQVSVLNAEIAHLNANYTYMITVAKISQAVGLGEDYLCENSENDSPN